MDVLFVDDDRYFHQSLASVLDSQKFKLYSAFTLDSARKQIESVKPDLVVLDIDLGKESGLDLLPLLEAQQTNFCILSGTVSVKQTVQALKAGALDVLEKPLSIEQIIKVMASVKENIKSNDSPWKSARVKQCEEELVLLAQSSAKVLLRGETGSGKEYYARMIHQNSSRSHKEFFAVNCAAIPPHLIEYELFGAKKGSFTGSDKDHIGILETADGSTLFLDEIAEIPYSLQAKLLRFLQESEIRPIGSAHTKKVDLRIITATHQALEDKMRNKEFREDLYFRISTFTIDIPSLRHRLEDLELLIQSIIKKLRKQYGVEIEFSESALNTLRAYSWPGNIRELESLIERFMILNKRRIQESDLPRPIQDAVTSLSLQRNTESDDFKTARDHFERHFISEMVTKHKSIGLTAERIGIDRSTLYKKMKQLGLDDLIQENKKE